MPLMTAGARRIRHLRNVSIACLPGLIRLESGSLSSIEKYQKPPTDKLIIFGTESQNILRFFNDGAEAEWFYAAYAILR